MSIKRKLIRNAMRHEGEKYSSKPSKYLRNAFDRYQIKKYGGKRRKINQAKGTHRRRTWKTRIAAVSEE